jgi:hypothetical protein
VPILGSCSAGCRAPGSTGSFDAFAGRGAGDIIDASVGRSQLTPSGVFDAEFLEEAGQVHQPPALTVDAHAELVSLLS